MSPDDETIETAAHALDTAWNPERYPVLTAMFRDYAQTALAAVLPKLLAKAWDEGFQAGHSDLEAEPACLIHDTSGEDVRGWEMAECTCPTTTEVK